MICNNGIDVLIVGVGGQGSLLASRVLGHLFLNEGLDVKVNEVHGMSQRGGSVITSVRAGNKVSWPLIGQGGADFLISFERMEALRWAHMLKRNGHLIASIQEILPMPVISGAAKYPDTSQLKGIWIDAIKLAGDTPKSANIAVLGAASKVMGFAPEQWYSALKTALPAKLLEVNIRAFDLGAQEAAKILDSVG